ncbi:MAG: hypothetical protein ACKOSS_12025 [Planctomycetia bacterium]
MPVTIADVVQHLEAGGLEVCPPLPGEESRSVVLPTHAYRDGDGQPLVGIVVRLLNQGTCLEASVPRAYEAGRAAHKAAFFDALLRMVHTFHHVRAGHDASDGEVALSVDMPLIEAEVSKEQVQAMVVTLLMTLEDFHEVLVHAMESGEIDLGRRLSQREPDVYGLAGDDDGTDGDDGGGGAGTSQDG